jgi:hypothetical protein
MENVVRLPLSDWEWFSYGHCYFAIQRDIETPNERLRWTNIRKDAFQNQFKTLRFSCLAPFNIDTPNELADPNLHERVRRLYDSKLRGDHCLICIETGDNLDSITRCSHLVCIPCYELYCNEKRYELEVSNRPVIINCPVCQNEVFFGPDEELATLSTKSKWVINKVRELIDEWNQEANAATKIVWFPHLEEL